MKKIDNFTKLYSLNKTLKFKLIPQGETLENFTKLGLIDEDQKRADAYVLIKKMMNRYHKVFIDEALEGCELKDIEEYAHLYFKNNKDDKEKKQMEKINLDMRKAISKSFSEHDKYSKLFKKEIIREILVDYIETDEEREALKKFRDFTTYFQGFFKNRKNMYSCENKSTEIGYRIINQNLHKYLDNLKLKILITDVLKETGLDDLKNNYSDFILDDEISIFSINNFSKHLSQKGIEQYNQIIGGYSLLTGEKIKGINEYINEYNQKNKTRIPKLKMLYKQILSDRDSISFIPEKFKNDRELVTAIKEFLEYISEETHLRTLDIFEELAGLFTHIENYNLHGVYVSSGPNITSISKSVFGDWVTIQNGLNEQYDSEQPLSKKKNIEKYEENRKKYFKGIKSYSLVQLQNAGNQGSSFNTSGNNVCEYIILESKKLYTAIMDAFKDIELILSRDYSLDKKLISDKKAVVKIKIFLDSIKDFQRFASKFKGSGIETSKDERFYAQYLPLLDQLNTVNLLYNKVRDYVTQKPYSNEKIKLNFDNPQFLGGWDRNKEEDYSSVLFKDKKYYYLGIMNKKSKNIFRQIPEISEGEEIISKMVYKLLSRSHRMLPKVFFSEKNIDVYAPSDNLMDKYNRGLHKKGENFDINFCHELIDFFKLSINKHNDWKHFNFQFSDTQEYENISEFYKEVNEQGYKLEFEDVSKAYIDKLVSEGKLFLFKIYNKDFSEYSKGKPNLHTMYFNALFDEDNLKDVIFALNGRAEMFVRKASIDINNATIHTSNEPIVNKNDGNLKKESVFSYDIIKDRRYTEDQFSLHIPVKANFKSTFTGSINLKVREELIKCDNNYVIGIDRGERNLIYITVVDEKGCIHEQRSFNLIKNEYMDGEQCRKYITDYHSLLDSREKENTKARKDWNTIAGIKNVKEGYISQVVHKICSLVEKYDAVIAIEDLNSGFKRSRMKVEKQVYQKFEKMLIDKLNFYVNKNLDKYDKGGLFSAYQLTNKFTSFKEMKSQNGFLFYIPPWLTSKIDPTTGFVDLINPRYKSVNDSKVLFSSFVDIRYNELEKYFEFLVDYSKMPRASTSDISTWTICTYGKRIKKFRNAEKNGQWDYEEIDLTAAMIDLFNQYDIDYNKNLKEQIIGNESKDFYKSLIKILYLTLQMRNSVTGTEIDYIISPIKNKAGYFYNSEEQYDDRLPKDADANGAYNIARKVLWIIEQLKKTSEEGGDIFKVKTNISNKEWLKYVQLNCVVE
ncbi:MAG: type V CRISPR-associated protein Cas12a/Cpf1 [Eubacteriales bacterium]|nr:type V CRISPR-associated protein Cas12a/Cpf1 [Eubacteriales bacterium]MDY3332746.1 type V CRISPR-associated protein Cas12a/Cpf1 [Gallibacter sp.]